MNARIAVLTSLGVAGLLVSALVQPGSSGWNDEQKPRKRPASETRKPQQRLSPPGPGRHLAFDVRPRDHQLAIRYVLEITHPTGKLTTHDLQKPALKRRSILVPLPALEPGKYKLVVIAESPTGPTRSQPLDLEVPKGT